ncbi:hypothetical protein O181_012659 [Austropuccinia psidii MF-1]|uniref:Uncharacterized protein n=1 Tax=Austropuccinia psidii MF-1 TaxID=1389203 RepID=A0A9Q3GN31_9BASI|nr:hypothetical protein [Austropuccinia psidii MF-1]
MKQMNQIRENNQAVSFSKASRPPAFKKLSMKAPKCFHGTQTFKARPFIQFFKLIFNNNQANFSEDRKKVLYAPSFLIGRSSKWIEPYLSNLIKKYPSYFLNNWELSEYQLLTLFRDPNEVRKAEEELNSSRIKEGGNLSF